MFQSFSGSSRRPRQVNLSGQNANPFNATTWSPSASGTQKAVAHAQQEREQRQRERDRLNASKRIQRVWRGHKTRRELAEQRRQIYDEKYNSSTGSDGVTLLNRVRLLLAFCNVRKAEDVARLKTFSQEITGLDDHSSFIACDGVQPLLHQLANVTLKALHITLSTCGDDLLNLLLSIQLHRPDVSWRISTSYYKFLSSLVLKTLEPKVQHGFPAYGHERLVYAITLPIREPSPLSDEFMLDIYSAMASHFLITPDLDTRLGGLQRLASSVDINRLGGAIVREYTNNTIAHVRPDLRLWLLAHFIALYNLRRQGGQEPELLRALSLQLSACSSDIIGRIDDSNLTTNDSSLPEFVRTKISSLVNKSSITSLLDKFNIDYAKGSIRGQEDASLLASYALTLLRIFPSRADEIRMWLCLGTMTAPNGKEIPALKFFWLAMSSTSTFTAIMGDSTAALDILRPQKRQNNEPSSFDLARDREWRTILLFLELYTFILKLTDDEEFLKGSSEFSQLGEKPSMMRDSALPIESVKKLTLFLKNISFTTFYNAAELSGDDQPIIEGGLGSYFGINGNSGRSHASSAGTSSLTPDKGSRPFAGITGMTFYYVRTIVIGVMRMLYERDSRRQFLPKDHWLMTTRFDMEGFIPAVVMEEERRHEVDEEQGEGDDDLDDDFASSGTLDLVGMARPRRVVQIERMREQQRKAARQKILATVGPRLEVLQNMPFVIPFETRVTIFRQFVYLDQTRRRGGNPDPEVWRMSIAQQSLMHGHRQAGREALGRHSAQIHRDRIFDDAYDAFYDLGEGLKEPIQITFVDKFDTQEAGIDGGGVTKEFLTSITNEAFLSESSGNLFVTNSQNLLYPNPAAIDERKEFLREAGFRENSPEFQESITDRLRQYEFLGRVIGKCLYEGILVDVNFAGFFLLKWTGLHSGQDYRVNINDLRDLDEELYQGLLKLKNYPGNVEDFGLDFTIVDTVPVPGSPTLTITRELAPNGSNTPVTNENRALYIAYVARHRLQIQPFKQTAAFLRGLGQIINPSWLSMFNQTELQTLIGGESSQIDIDDLRRNTQYGGVYEIGDDGLEHPTIQIFWHVMREMKDEDRRKVLKYVTSTPRAPLLGFSQLIPKFSIRDSSSDEERLPSTSTCVNLLKLPRYSSVEKLRSKLLYAVNSGAGFDLS